MSTYFSKEVWNECIQKKDWNSFLITDDLDEKVAVFKALMDEAMNEVTPMKTFTVKSNHITSLEYQMK